MPSTLQHPSIRIPCNIIKKRHASACRFRLSKSLAEFAAKAAKKVQIVFGRGVYVDENTSQAASVEFGRQRRANYAHSRLPNTGGKPRRFFSTSESGMLRHAAFVIGSDTRPPDSDRPQRSARLGKGSVILQPEDPPGGTAGSWQAPVPTAVEARKRRNRKPGH